MHLFICHIYVLFYVIVDFFHFPIFPPHGLSGSRQVVQCSNAGWQGSCPHCWQEYANLSSLKYHVRLVHSDAKNTICCYLCPRKMLSKVALREHLLREHQVKYQ